MSEAELKIHRRLDTIERLLESVVHRLDQDEKNVWITTDEFLSIAGISRRHLQDVIATGVFGDAIKNVGTVKRPRYRFHKTRALNLYLNRSVKS